MVIGSISSLDQNINLIECRTLNTALLIKHTANHPILRQYPHTGATAITTLPTPQFIKFRWHVEAIPQLEDRGDRETSHRRRYYRGDIKLVPLPLYSPRGKR